MLRRLLPIAVVAVLAASCWTGAARAQAPGSGPGGPVLVVAGGGFGSYYAEILRAEGLNAFSVIGSSGLDAAALAPYQTVILGAGAVSDAQVAALSAWVQGGGNLIAMRPDPKLAGLLGIGADAGDLAQGYMGIDTGTPPGAGITGTTMQYHGVADLWAPAAGTRQVAALYSNATTPTGTAAVTLRDVGSSGGQAAAFAYDLASSVVYTRQGNPDNAGEEHDGAPDAVRSSDLFLPDWVDPARIAIPQADEQQRLLANLVTQMSLDRMPLPRFWYLPRGEQAAVVMTGDDHNSGETVLHFNKFDAEFPQSCSVADWECVRATSYVFPNTPITAQQANAYQADGFEIALHLDTGGCSNLSDAALAATLATQLTQFRTHWPALSPRTNRTHCVAWTNWAGTPKVELGAGIRLDTNYYYWPASWALSRPGMFTGSGFPMRFADLDGSIIDVYQAATQLTDELDSTFAHVDPHIKALLAGAVGPQGYYGVFTMNMHTDDFPHAGADAIVAEAKRLGVPIVSAAQMLDWLDGRNSATFGGLSYAGGQLQFSVARDARARGIEAMVPGSATGGALLSLTRDGAPVPVTGRTVKGIDYAVFAAEPGQYVATYPPPPGSQPPGQPSGNAPADRAKPRLKVRTKRARVSRKGKVVLRARCPKTEVRCRIAVKLRHKGKRIASGRKTVAGGKTAKITVRLTRAARRKLARAGSLKAQAVWTTRDAAGNKATKRTRVKLLAPRPR